MTIGIFIFYFVLFTIIFVISRNKEKPVNWKVMICVPAILALLIFLLTVVKIYIIYKIILLFVFLGLGALTYWHYRDIISIWFRGP